MAEPLGVDSVTRDIRAQYEQYPYPTRFQRDLNDCHPQLFMSYRKGYERHEQLRILDAGCGTGMLSLGTALHNPECVVTALDVNRVALEALRAEADRLGLSNLGVVEADLLSPDSLPSPEGGYDLIYCGGVIHHLADPTRGLANLVNLLAPGGVMRLMVYNTLGRQALYRFVNALDMIHHNRSELADRLILGRELMRSIKRGPVLEYPWHDGSNVSDAEFVDRYLNLNDRSYSVKEFMELLREVGLTFLRWFEPQEWNLESYLEQGELLNSLQSESDLVKYQMVEQLSNRVMMDAVVGHRGAQLQKPGDDLQQATIAVNPQVTLQVCHESVGSMYQEVAPRAYLRGRYSIPLNGWDFEALKTLSSGPLPASVLAASESERHRLTELLRRELVYRYQTAE